ncbi:uncharacterized protein [Amphiura filiformis]|uniref:uncharacterized protein n=1 Tax=Amphiura filiformis TaxID=82378 RepID=UPI003B22004B
MSSKPKVWVALNYHALMNELEESEEKLLEELEIHANREYLHPALKDAGMCLQVSTLVSDPVGKVFTLDPVGVDLSLQEPMRVSQRDIFYPQRTKTTDYSKIKGWRDTEDEGKKWKTILLPQSIKNQRAGPKSKGKQSNFVKPQQMPSSKQKTPPQATQLKKNQRVTQLKQSQPVAQVKKSQPVAQVKKSPPLAQTKPKTVLIKTSQKVPTVPKLKITGVLQSKPSDPTQYPLLRRPSREITRPRYLQDTVDDNFIEDYVKVKKSVKKPERESIKKPERELVKEPDKKPEREPIKLILPKPKSPKSRPESPKGSKPASPIVPPITLACKKPKTAAEAAKYGIKQAMIVKKRKTPVLDEWDTPQISGLKKPVKDFAALLSKKLEGGDDSEKQSTKIPEQESRFFKTFEKPITSKKSAFVSDSLDEYLKKDKDTNSPEYNPFSHPLLQNKSAVVTFQMPTKQQRGIKTLKMKLEERRKLALKRCQSVSSTADATEKNERKVDQSENLITVKPFVPRGTSLNQHIANEKKEVDEETRGVSKTDFTSVLNKGLNERIAYLKGETFEKKVKERLEQMSGKNSPLESEDSGSDDVYSRSGPRTLGHITGTCRTKATEIHFHKKVANKSVSRTKATETNKTKASSDSDDVVEILSSDSNSDAGSSGTCRTKASETVRYGGLAETTGSKKTAKKSAMVKVAQEKIKASQKRQQSKSKDASQQSKPKDTSKTKWKTQLQIVNNKLVHNTKPLILSKAPRSFMPVRDPNSPPMKAILRSTPTPQSRLADTVDSTNKDVNKSVIISDLEECVIEDDSDHDIEEVQPLPVCGKDFCRLGCVCDSLKRAANPNRPRVHCNKAECMFKCVCGKATDKVRILRNRKRPSYFNSEDMFFYDTEGMMSNIQEKKKPRLLTGSLSDPAPFTCARTRNFHAYMPSTSTQQQKDIATSSKQESIPAANPVATTANQDLGSLVLKQSGSDYLLKVDPATRQIYAISAKDPNGPIRMLPAKLKSLIPMSPEDQTVRFESLTGKATTSSTPSGQQPLIAGSNIIATSSSSSNVDAQVASAVSSPSQAFPVSLTKVSESDIATDATLQSRETSVVEAIATPVSAPAIVSASITSSHPGLVSADVILESNEEVASSSGKAKKKKKKKGKKHQKDKEAKKNLTSSLQGTQSAVPFVSTMQGNTANVALPPQCIVVPASGVGNALVSGNVQQVVMVPQTAGVPSNPLLQTAGMPSNPVLTSPVGINTTSWQNIASQGGRLIIGGAALGNWVQATPITTPGVKPTPQIAPALMTTPARPATQPSMANPSGIHPGFPAPVRLPAPASLLRPAVLINGKAYTLMSGAPGVGNVPRLVALGPGTGQLQQTYAPKTSTSVAVSPAISSPLSPTWVASESTVVTTSSPYVSSSDILAPASSSTMIPKISPSIAELSPSTMAPVTSLSTVVPISAATATLSATAVPSTATSVHEAPPSTVMTTASQVITITSPSTTADMSVPKTSPSTSQSPASNQSPVNTSVSSQKILSGPMLIEIQSDCNWDRHKNEILSEIAKHTTAATKVIGGKSGRTAVRVGKYVVEIVNKQAVPGGAKPSPSTGVKTSPSVSEGVKTSPSEVYESAPPVKLGSHVSHQGVTTFFPPSVQQESSKDDDDEVMLIDDQSEMKSTDSIKSPTKQVLIPVSTKISGKNDGGKTRVTDSTKTPISSILPMDENPDSPDVIEMMSTPTEKADSLEIIDVPDSPEPGSSTRTKTKKVKSKVSSATAPLSTTAVPSTARKGKLQMRSDWLDQRQRAVK